MGISLRRICQRGTIFLGLVIIVGCVADPSSASRLPILIDQRLGPMNLIGTEILIREYEARNSIRLQELLGRTSLADQQEFRARMDDRGLRWELRLLYAAILAAQGEASGQRFLIEQAGSTPPAKLMALNSSRSSRFAGFRSSPVFFAMTLAIARNAAETAKRPLGFCFSRNVASRP